MYMNQQFPPIMWFLTKFTLLELNLIPSLSKIHFHILELRMVIK